ncbi:acyl-CoA thioesterase [Novosphingobium aureum]|nr:acyl-CoA thioesterase [Novosphingobium aureum]
MDVGPPASYLRFMPKPDPALLDPARYPFSCDIEPRFGDQDLNRHLNNVAIASFIEDARVRFYHANGFRAHIRDLNVMIVSVAIEYLGQAHYPGAITIHCAVEKIGRSSLTLVQVLRQGETLVGFARSVMVAVDPQGAVQPVPQVFDGWMLRS